MILPMVVLSLILLVAYYIMDSYYYRKEGVEIDENSSQEKLSIEGSFNFILILGVVMGVLLSGMKVFKFDIN